jgi:hypothetical protein
VTGSSSGRTSAALCEQCNLIDRLDRRRNGVRVRYCNSCACQQPGGGTPGQPCKGSCRAYSGRTAGGGPLCPVRQGSPRVSVKDAVTNRRSRLWTYRKARHRYVKPYRSGAGAPGDYMGRAPDVTCCPCVMQMGPNRATPESVISPQLVQVVNHLAGFAVAVVWRYSACPTGPRSVSLLIG